VPKFVLFYRRGRSKHELDELIDARTRQAALENIRRFVVANLRRGGRVKVVAVGELVEIEPEPPEFPKVGIFWRVRWMGNPTLAMAAIRYASTIWAMTRRNGEYYNFSVSHQVGAGGPRMRSSGPNPGSKSSRVCSIR
jgi:hypothetical protein